MSWTQLTAEDIRKCSGHEVTIDIETDGLLWWKNQIIGIGIYCPDAGVVGYMPTLTPVERREGILAVQGWGKGTLAIAHNAKFEMHFLNMNPFLQGIEIYDTMDLVHLIDSRLPKALEKVEKIFLGTSSKREHVDEATFDPVINASRGKKGKGRKKPSIWEWGVNTVAKYCINDCVVEHALYEKLKPIVEELGLWKLFVKDMAYLKELWLAERRGMLLDVEFTENAIRSMKKDLKDLEQKLYDSIGYEFNWRSHIKLSKAIYEDMGIPKPKNPFAGADGVDRSRFAGRLYNKTMTNTFLLMEKAKHPLGELISQIRESDKLRATMETWLELKDDDEIIHTNFKLTGTRTARLSSDKPPVQNIAAEVRTRHTQSVFSGQDQLRTETYNLRQGFRARPGFKFLSIDYSQMEMRMFGILSQDPFMLDSLAAGRDVHADIAEKVWGVRDKVHREWSKTISFGLIYGMTLGSLMHRLDMPRSEAKRVTDDYFASFPAIKPWMDAVIQECREYGYIRYWSGRIWREDALEDMYVGANAQIQGGCADFLSVVAIRVGKWLRKNIPEAGIVSFIHDELLIEVPDDKIQYAAVEIQEIMKAPDIFGIPWKCAAKVGDSYGTLKDISGYEF